MTAGKRITVVADKNKVLERVLVSVEDGVYFVCRDEEYDAARRDGREPVCIGFRREYILNEEAA
jgi:hypothetical protein